jgi:glycosyltransferase involved in cell wall biosynthesis
MPALQMNRPRSDALSESRVSRLRVGLDLTFANRNQAGSGVYARSLAAALEARSDIDLTILAAPRSGLLATLDWLLRGANRALAARPPALLHCPAVVAPWNLRVPYVVTIHDHSSALFPADHPAEWLAYEKWFLPRRARAAERVITGTQFARAQLVEAFRLDPARVVVTPYGVDPRFHAAGRDRRPLDGEEAQLLLFPGAPVARKNLEAVLEAMAGAPAGSRLASARLAISGALAEAYPTHVERTRRLGLGGRVDWLGKVPAEAMPALLAAATVVVYPSRYEGFGLPALEAMAAGTPLVASNAACLPEVVGDGGLLVAPDDVPALRQALEAVLTQPELRQRLVEAGRRRASAFTWERCAELTLRTYHAVLA